jgi:hypothetical protein
VSDRLVVPPDDAEIPMVRTAVPPLGLGRDLSGRFILLLLLPALAWSQRLIVRRVRRG